ELVPGELGGLVVAGGDGVRGGAGGQGAELEQWWRGGGAVQVPVADDRSVAGGLGAAGVRGQVLDEVGAGARQGGGPVVGDAVGAAGVGDDVAERDAVGGHGSQDGGQGAGGV